MRTTFFELTVYRVSQIYILYGAHWKLTREAVEGFSRIAVDMLWAG